MDALELEPGTLVGGRYRVEAVVGRGGMATVYAAQHLGLEAGVALKVLHPSLCTDATVVRRFAREARNACRLTSEYVARVTDYGRLESGEAFLVMELLQGEDLQSCLRARGALPTEEAVDLLLQVLAGLAAAHAHGIVHRDLKPANIFVLHRPDGSRHAKVLDFGISTACTTTDEQELTTTRVVLGSPHFMSPEQMANARTADARSDLWSVGVVAYRMLTGVLPFRGKHLLEVTHEVAQGSPQRMTELAPDLPAGIEGAIMKALAHDPCERHQSVAEFARALLPFAPRGAEELVASIERILSGSAPPDLAATGEFTASLAIVQPPTTSAVAPPPERRAPALRRGLLAVLLVLLGLGLGILVERRGRSGFAAASPPPPIPGSVPPPSPSPLPSIAAPAAPSVVCPPAPSPVSAPVVVVRPAAFPSDSASTAATATSPPKAAEPLPSDPWGWE